MSFRVQTMKRDLQVLVVCEGHLDAQAITAIQHALEAAQGAGLQAVVRVCRGATADRPAVACLAGYPVDRLEVESPFLRSWLAELRALRVGAADSDRAGEDTHATGF